MLSMDNLFLLHNPGSDLQHLLADKKQCHILYLQSKLASMHRAVIDIINPNYTKHLSIVEYCVMLFHISYIDLP